jgi:hypothetical protein
VKPWLFVKWKGSKVVEVHGGGNLEITWDLPNARFGTGPEPLKVSTSLLFMILKLSLCLATYITRRRMARLHLMLYIQMQS